MIKASRKARLYAFIVACLLLVAYALRFANGRLLGKMGMASLSGSLPWIGDLFSQIRFVIYTGVIIAWGLSVHYRVLHPQIRRFFAMIAALMVFWMVLRQVKFAADDLPDLKRYLWYLYYIPMLLIPMFAFLISMYLGRAEDYRLPEWTRVLPIIAAALVLLVLTNDLHEWVFTFPEGAWGHDDADYGYAALFYLVFGWRIAGLLVTLGMIFWRSRIPQSQKLQIQPMIPSLLLFVYGLLYLTGFFNDPIWMENITITESLLEIAIFESCFRCGLIQSNTHYAELFGRLGYPSVIVDENYDIVYASDELISLSGEQMKKAETGTVELGDGLLLKSMPIRGGHILWIEDISGLLALQEEKDRMAKELIEERDLLQAEIEMKKKQAILDTRNRLYDSMTRDISSQFAEIDRLVSVSYQSEEERRRALRRMCVIGAYIKRRSNLLYLNEENNNISSEELFYCIRESADYIRSYGADCMLHAARTGKISTERAKLAYDLFEHVVETVLSTLSAMLVYMDAEDGGLRMNVQSECGVEEIDLEDMAKRVGEKDGEVSIACENGVLYVRLLFHGEVGIS